MAKRRTILIKVDGEVYASQKIGQGSFSKVFRVGDRAVYYTKGDCAKEVLAMYQYDRMTHLPEMIRHDNVTTDLKGERYSEPFYVFSTPIYVNVTKQHKSAHRLMLKIIREWHVFWRTLNIERQNADVMQQFIDYLEDTDMPRSVIRALQELLNVTLNCGFNIGWDLIKQNFGVNSYGTLIFRDVVWVRQ